MTTTVQLARRWGGLTDRGHKWQVIIDGTVAGSVDRQQTVEIPIEPGRHTLRVKSSERFQSRERSFEAADEQVIRFRCRSQLMWPMYIAALIRPDLWIRLTRE